MEVTALWEGDVVFEDFEIENQLLQHESKQEWYYASDQGIDEVWMFLQADFRKDGLEG